MQSAKRSKDGDRHANPNLSALSSSTILFWEWCAQSYTTVPAKIWTSVKLCEVSPLWGATLANILNHHTTAQIKKKKHPSSHQPPPFFYHQKNKASKSSGSNTNNKAQMIQMPFQPHPPPSPSAAPRKAQSLELKKAPQSHQPVTRGRWGRLPPNQPGKNVSSFVWERRWAGFKPANP